MRIQVESRLLGAEAEAIKYTIVVKCLRLGSHIIVISRPLKII